LVTLPDFQALMASAPWAAVLVICVPSVVVLLIVCICVFSVSKDKRVEAMKASAEVIKAMKPGKAKSDEPKPNEIESKVKDSDELRPSS
jgi:mannitol-specific phosphotransferase system IIBC component